MTSTIKEMFKDYMFYGYDLKFFIKQDYAIVKDMELKELKTLWEQVKNEMGGVF